MQKNRFDYCEIQTWKSNQIWRLNLENTISLGVLWEKKRIIYAKKRVNNFLNNAEQKIISCKIVEIVYTENSEQFLWENNENFYLIQKTDRKSVV